MDNDLAFWIEWVKMTEEQREDLLPHIHDDNILAEIAIHEESKEDESIGHAAISMITDNELLLYAASKVSVNSLLRHIADRFDIRTSDLLRRFFDIPNVTRSMETHPEAFEYIMCDNDVDVDELINHYSKHPALCVRNEAFDTILVKYLDYSGGVEYDRYLKVLQNMAVIEPDEAAREYMCHKLDHITEDSI